MAHSITPLANGLARARFVAWPLLVEATLVAAVIGLLLPAFAPLDAQDSGRGARYADAIGVVRGLPDPVLPELCARHAVLAEDGVGARLCDAAWLGERAQPVDRIPPVLLRALTRTVAAFRAPLDEAAARMAELREQQRDGTADLLALDQALDAARSEVEPFVRRYGLDGDAAQGPRALACLFDWLRGSFTATPQRSGPAADVLRANAVLLAGAALDAHAATAALATTVMLPGGPIDSPRCAGLAGAEALAAAAMVMSDARSAHASAGKNEAMRALLHDARWQWAGGALLGLVLVNLSRRGGSWIGGMGIALAVWALAAWAGRVPWPLGGEHAFVLGRTGASWRAAPAPFVFALAGLGAALLLLAPLLRKATRVAPAEAASVIAYPGLVLATGVGWLLLLDLSANGHYGNRYLALYHHGHLWLGAMTLTLVAFVREPLGRALAWVLSLIDGAATRLTARLGPLPAGVLLLSLGLLGMTAAALLLLNLRQVTSELGRLWLIVGAAWFFFLRGTPLTERLARSAGSLMSLVRYIWPLAFVVVVLIGAMVVTRDMGPLLIAGYGAGAFVAASVALWRHQRTGAIASAYAIAILVFTGWIAVTTLALFRLGSIDDVTAARLENAAAPLASANDHLALVTWFQEAAPPNGFGPGAVPWCGFGASRGCAGVPAQIQSDYTFTALIGMFGWVAAWALTLGCALWLYRIVRRHAVATRGEPRLLRSSGRVVHDEQAFVSWLCVTWVVLALCQLAVTVAGNLAVIPLTGVTFPFVSFGMTSLIVNLAMLGLALNVRPARAPVDA